MVYPALVLKNKIVLFTGDIQTNEHTVHVWSPAIKHKGLTSCTCTWKHRHTHTRTHTKVHLVHCSIHLFKQSENKRGRWRLTLHMSKIPESSWVQTFLLPSTVREGPLTKISKGIKCIKKKKICICIIFIYQKNLQILSIWRSTQHGRTMIPRLMKTPDMWRSCPSLLIILRLLTPLMWGEKKKNSHRSPQAIRMAVYDASQWGCAQLRPANETRTFGTIRPFSNIILCSPAANWTWWKAKGWFWCCCLGANCWRRPRGRGYLFLNKNIKKQQLSFCLKTLSLALMEVLCPGLFLRTQTTNQAK